MDINMNGGRGGAALVCNPHALSPEQRHQHGLDASELFHRASKILDVPTGIKLQFRNEGATLLLAAEFVADEAACCPFLHFEVDVEPPNGLLELSMTGPDGTREFLRDTFAELLREKQNGTA